MALITIAAAKVDEYHHATRVPTTARWRLKRSATSYNNSSVPILTPRYRRSQPGTYQDLTITMNGAEVILDECILYSTTDSTVATNTGCVDVYDQNGREILELRAVIDSLRIPASPTSTTWEEIRIYNVAAPTPADVTWLDQVTALLLGYVKLIGNQTVAGIKTFSSSPIVPDPTTALQVANKEYADSASALGGGLGSILFDGAKLQHINCGRFYKAGVNYSHCFWEVWIRPVSTQNGPGYVVVDDEGGDHNTLFGISNGGAGGTSFTITGNTTDGTTLQSYVNAEAFPAGYDVHLAWGWDGSHILTWVDGILSSITAWSPSQRKNPGSNNATLFLMGSDHANASGRLYQVRGYEGYGRCAEVGDFQPELFFRSLQHPGGGSAPRDVPQFLMNLQRPKGMFVDGSKFEGVPHHGIPEAAQSVSGYQTSPVVGYTLALPTFVSGAITTGLYTPTAPATPAGAVIFDSASRPNRTSVSPNPDSVYGYYTPGTTEVGNKTWARLDGASPATGMGILNGRFFISYGGPDWGFDTGLQNVDVRVDRLPTSYCMTGLRVRYKDDNDYYRIIASTETNIDVYKVVGGVTTTVSYTVSAGWTTLRVTASGTAFNVYVGTATEGVFTLAGSFTGSNVTGATKTYISTINRVPKQVWRWDNFLVKAL